MIFSKSLRIAVLTCGVAWSVQAQAASTGGCDSFEWPLSTELAWMTAAGGEPVASGVKLAGPPMAALLVGLQPMDSVAFEVPPTGKSKADGDKTFGGVVLFEGLEGAGLYQVSLSGIAWVDVVQNGKALSAAGHTGKSDCAGLRKSVRFNLEAAPFAIQVGGVPSSTIKITIRRAE